jgi:hypothetical protein
MRLPTTLAFLALAATLLFGCGGSNGSSTSGMPGADRVPRENMGTSAAALRSAWEATASCRRPAGASRWACSIGPWRCQAVVTDRGWSVDCAKPGGSIPFTVPPRN